MSERHITFSKPAKFIDPETDEPVQVPHADWVPTEENPQPTPSELIDHPERSFEWFLNVYILSHQLFSFEFGGYEAVKARKEISKACEAGIEADVLFMTVTDEQDRLIRQTMKKLAKKDESDKRAVIMSSRGMTRKMSNFESGCYMEHMDALQGSQPNKPEPKLPPTEEAQSPLPEASQETDAKAEEAS